MSRKKLCLYAVTQLEFGKLTDTATAVISKQLQILCYQALKTNFANSGSEYVLSVMKTAIETWTRNNNSEFIEAVTEQEIYSTQKEVRHNYVIRDGVRIPVKPYTTLEFTQDGKQAMTETKHNETETTITFDDLIQTAWTEAVMPLNKLGVLTSFDSLFSMKRIIYRVVNNHFYSERKHVARQAFSFDDSENGNQISDDEQAEAMNEAENEMLLQTLRLIVCNKLRKNVDSVKAWNAWKLCKYDGLSVRYVASDILGIHKTQVQRYIDLIQKIVVEYMEKKA